MFNQQRNPQHQQQQQPTEIAEFRTRKRKRCPFTAAGIKEIDYKDTNTLTKFITERGKILPRRITGVSAFY